MATLPINHPCERTWSSLEGSGSQRYCSACDQVVHDLRELEPEAVGALLFGRKRACVRVLAAAVAATALATSSARADEPLGPEPAVRPYEGSQPEGEAEVMGALDRRLITEPLDQLLEDLTRDYQRRLTRRPGLEGTIVVKFTIADGVVTRADVKSSTVRDAVLERIVVRAVRGVEFTRLRAMDTGLVIGTYPFEFQSTKCTRSGDWLECQTPRARSGDR
jgi:hypothetical protein